MVIANETAAAAKPPSSKERRDSRVSDLEREVQLRLAQNPVQELDLNGVKEQLKDILQVINFFKEEQDRRESLLRQKIDTL